MMTQKNTVETALLSASKIVLYLISKLVKRVTYFDSQNSYTKQILSHMHSCCVTKSNNHCAQQCNFLFERLCESCSETNL